MLAGQKAKGTLPARLTFALAALVACIVVSLTEKRLGTRTMHTGWNVIATLEPAS
ncbi:hypothetical protein ACLK1U_08835 [Escherichia coli]